MYLCPECGQTFQEGGFCTEDGTALVFTGDDPMLGATLGPYRLVRMVGVGGMGRVYKGLNPTIRSRVAVKVLSHDCADRPEVVDRFFAEARAVNLIRHENIVNILDLARLADGRPYIVMEFLDGSPLSALLLQHGRLPLGTLARWMAEVLAGLGAAHAKGVVHRDLKPDNIFVTGQGRAKILDFGVAKLAAEHRDGATETRAGSLLGTPHYMSPEQAQSRPIDARSDLYAIGVILYEAATGQRPVDGDSVFEILRRQVDVDPPPPRRFAPEMPPAYEHVIVRAMAKDPARRWQSADELARALEGAAAGLTPVAWGAIGGAPLRQDSGGLPPTPAPTPHHGSHADSHRSRAPLIAAGGMVLAAAIIAAIVVSQQPDGESRGERPEPSAQVASAEPGAGGAESPDPSALSTSSPSAAAPDEAARGPAGAGPGDAGPGRGPEQKASDEATGAGAQDAGAQAGDLGGNGQKKPGRRGRERRAGEDQRRPVDPADTAGPADTGDVGKPGESEPTKDTGGGAGEEEDQSANGSALRAASWDVSGYLPTALARARKKFPDAVLVRIDADGVYPSGKSDLTLDKGFSILYRFMSPSRAKRPADLPQGVEHKPTCIYYVSIDRDSVSAYPLEGWSCEKYAPIRMPRCSVRQIWRRAAAEGAPTKNAVASLSYRVSVGGGEPQWWFDIGKQHQHVFDDDC